MKHSYIVIWMHCEWCVNKITSKLKEKPLIEEVSIDRQTNIAEVTMSSHVTTAEMNSMLKGVWNYSLEEYTDKHSHKPIFSKELPTTYTWKNFIPLIWIVLLVVILTIIAQFFHNPYWMDEIILHLMGFWFIIFGFMKLIDLKGFAEAYSTYDLIAKKRYNYAYIYPFIEIALWIIFIAVRNWPLLIYANILMVIIMIIGARGIYIQLKKGNKIQCACLGTYFKLPMTTITLIEDLSMVILWIIMLSIMIWYLL